MKRYEAELRWYTYDENGTKLFSSALFTGGPFVVIATPKRDVKIYGKIDYEKDEIVFERDLVVNKEHGASKKYPNYVYGMPEPKDGEILEISPLRIIDMGPLNKQRIVLKIGGTQYEGLGYGNETYKWKTFEVKEGDRVKLPLLETELLIESVEENYVLLSVDEMGEKKLFPYEQVRFDRDARTAYGNTEDQVFGTFTRYCVELVLE